jgi:GrpB-like predicted nucleotidyltransferase (UPF0157 family)
VSVFVAQKALEAYKGTAFEQPLRTAFQKLQAATGSANVSASWEDFDSAISFRHFNAYFLGIEGREAFANPDGLPMHNLYLCPRDSVALANQLAIRNYLRTHPEAAREYGELNKRLAERFPDDIDGYIDGKTTMLLTMLRATGFPPEQLREIERANRK